MNWHDNCRKAHISFVELSPGQLIPCCNSCGEIAPSEDESTTVASLTDADWSIPPEPQPDKRNLYWPSSVEYIDESPPSGDDSSGSSQSPSMGHKGEDTTSPYAVPDKIESPCFVHLSGRQIRLLKLRPGNFNDPLHVRLKVEDFQVGVEYEALSYTWASDSGNFDRKCSVYHGDEWDIIKTTESCANALRRLRYRNKPRTLWVDALCINQEDIDERSHQVDMMAEIYACAKQVIVYLGEEELCGDCTYDDVTMLCRKPYFSRMWVIQELAYASSKVLMCGSKSWDWGVFFPVASECSWLKHVNTRKLRESSELFELIRDTKACNASDKRDRIFALLGLIIGSKAAGLSADYSISLSHVMIGITAYILAHHSASLSRRILFQATAKCIEGGPSWVPELFDHRFMASVMATVAENTITLKGFEAWSPLIDPNHVQGGGLTVCRQEGCLKVKGFQIATGPDVYNMTYCDSFPFWKHAPLYVYGEKVEQGHAIFYLPQLRSLVLLAPGTTTKQCVVSTLAGFCSASEEYAWGSPVPVSAVEIICPPHSGPTSDARVVNLVSWTKALFKSDLFPDLDLSRLLDPWDKSTKFGKETKAEHSVYKMQRLRMLLRKAVFHRQRDQLQDLVMRKESSNKEPLIKSRLLYSYIGHLRAFTQEAIQYKTTLEDCLDSAIDFWKLLSNLWNGVPRPSHSLDIPAPWGTSFRTSLVDLLQIKPSPIGRRINDLENQFLDEFINFLCQFGARHAPQNTLATLDKNEQDLLALERDFFLDQLLPCSTVDNPISNDTLNAPNSDILDSFTLSLLRRGDGITNRSYPTEQRWRELEHHYGTAMMSS